MFKLNRTMTRRTGTSITPSSRPVQQLPDFDTALPALFPEPPDLDELTAHVLGQLERLTAANALDGEHGAILDSLVAEAMAPYYEATHQHLATSVRVIEQIDQQGIETAVMAFDRGLKAQDAAATAEQEADQVYAAAMGRGRACSDKQEPTDWEALKGKLRAHRLVLQPNKAILAFLGRGFRIGSVKHVTADPPVPQLALVDQPDEDATDTNDHSLAN